MKKPISQKQLEANRKNAKLSRGPVTPAGRAKSCRNGLKHGFTGKHIVIHGEDAAALDDRLRAYTEEMRPHSQVAMNLVGRIALLSVKLERCSVHEAKTTSYRQRKAIKDFDDARLAEAEHMMMYIATAPATHARRLRTSPEGIDLLIESLRTAGRDLYNERGIIWSYHHCDVVHHAMGKRTNDVPTTRHQALSEAIMGDHRKLNQHAEGPAPEEMGKEDQKTWCAEQMIDLINVEIIKLQELKKTLDLEELEMDRADAAARAIVGDSKEEINARKYEAAIDRQLSKARKEFREVQLEIPAPLPPPIVAIEEEEMGSCSPEIPEEEGEDVEEETIDATDATAPENDVPTAEIVAEGPSGVAPGPDRIDER